MKIFFVINGARGPVPADKLARMDRILAESGHPYQIAISRSLEESRQLVKQAEESGFDTLWMGGGDGTINVLLNQVMPTKMTLGVVPMGTVNALARAFGIPMKSEDACRFLLAATPRSMNLGCVNKTRLFLCFASVGFDAAVVHDVGGAFKRVGGRLAYAAAAVASVFSMKRIVPFTMHAKDGAQLIEDETKPHPPPSHTTAAAVPTQDRGYSLVVSNISNYAGFTLFPDAHPTAGSMEMWLFRDRRLDAMAVWSAVTLLGLNRWKRHLRRNVGHYFVRNFLLESHQPLYLQVDGEAVILEDGRRLEFEFQKEAVRVLAAAD